MTACKPSAVWQRPLRWLNLAAGIARLHGKKVCIIDVDSAGEHDDGGAFWEEMASLPQDVMPRGAAGNHAGQTPGAEASRGWTGDVLLASLTWRPRK